MKQMDEFINIVRIAELTEPRAGRSLGLQQYEAEVNRLAELSRNVTDVAADATEARGIAKDILDLLAIQAKVHHMRRINVPHLPGIEGALQDIIDAPLKHILYNQVSMEDMDSLLSILASYTPSINDNVYKNAAKAGDRFLNAATQMQTELCALPSMTAATRDKLRAYKRDLAAAVITESLAVLDNEHQVPFGPSKDKDTERYAPCMRRFADAAVDWHRLNTLADGKIAELVLQYTLNIYPDHLEPTDLSITICAFCVDPGPPYTFVRFVPCGHIGHKACVLGKKHVCAECKAAIVHTEPHAVMDKACADVAERLSGDRKFAAAVDTQQFRLL